MLPRKGGGNQRRQAEVRLRQLERGTSSAKLSKADIFLRKDVERKEYLPSCFTKELGGKMTRQKTREGAGQRWARQKIGV